MSVFSSRSEEFSLHQSKNRRHRIISVSLTITRGKLCIDQVVMRHRGWRSSIATKLYRNRLQQEHDLKVVWVTDIPDDSDNGLQDAFVVITPEHSYILQADSRRKKIEWMQTIAIAISQCLQFRHSYRPSTWNHLEDLQQWLTIREVSYTFTSRHPQYGGAKYYGKWSVAMPHIKGKLRWSNGKHYDGDFLHGLIHGSGSMLWLDHVQYRNYTGNWQDGQMEGFGEMSYRDNSVFIGWWHNGQRHGHGTMIYRPSGSVYIGDWKADLRQGYGIMTTDDRSCVYLGLWRDDKYHGYGVLIDNGKIYEGHFDSGEKRILLKDSLMKCSIVQEKWSGLFHTCAALLEQMGSIEHTIEPSTLNYDTRDSCSPSRTSNCSVCSVEGFRMSYHPLGILVTNLTKAFKQSYKSAHSTLLPHAITELKYILERTHQIIEKHCPHLTYDNDLHFMGRPRSRLSVLLAPLEEFFSCEKDCDWLHPIFFPPIYSTLFTLYQANNLSQDRNLTSVLSELQWYNCNELWHIFLPETSKELLASTEKCIEDSVTILQLVSNYHVPFNKLLCLRDVHLEITKQHHSHLVHALWCCIIIKAKIPSLFSEIQFVEDFGGSTVDSEFCLISLKEAAKTLESLSRTRV